MTIENDIHKYDVHFNFFKEISIIGGLSKCFFTAHKPIALMIAFEYVSGKFFGR